MRIWNLLPGSIALLAVFFLPVGIHPTEDANTPLRTCTVSANKLPQKTERSRVTLDMDVYARLTVEFRNRNRCKTTLDIDTPGWISVYHLSPPRSAGGTLRLASGAGGSLVTAVGGTVPHGGNPGTPASSQNKATWAEESRKRR